MFILLFQGCNLRKILPTAPMINEPVKTAPVTLTMTPVFSCTMTGTYAGSPSETCTYTQTMTATETFTFTKIVSFTNTGTVTPVVSPTNSPTITVTYTQTPIMPKGSAQLSPSWAVMNSTGNMIKIIYKAGLVSWAGAPGYGTIKITVPSGFSVPSLNSSDPGYFTVAADQGTIYSSTVSGMDIIVKVRDLISGTGIITVNYGDRSGGGPGVVIQINEGQPVFAVEMTESGDTTAALDSSPSMDIVAPLGSASIFPSAVLNGTTGNITELIYTPATTWQSGTLRVQVPDGFSQPSINPAAPGYFTVNVTGGSLTQVSTDAMYIIINAFGIPNDTGKIVIDYGSTAGGGPGFTAPVINGYYTFKIESDNNGNKTHPILLSPQLLVDFPTFTVTPTFTFTMTHTLTPTTTLTPTISLTPTKTPTSAKTNTSTRTVSPTASSTRTISPTYTITKTGTITQTFTITRTFTMTFTITLSSTPANTLTITPTRTFTPTFTSTRTFTPTKTTTFTKTPTFTATSTITPTFTVTPTSTPREVVFNDANLELKVRAAINKPSGLIYQTDVQDLTTLNAFSSSITDLTGLEECVSLTVLSLYGNSITDITPLSGLVKLSYLDLNLNSITDTTPLVTNVDAGGFADGSQIFLNNNPLSAKATGVDIPYLQSKSVTVTY
jgi:hypothetical protein